MNKKEFLVIFGATSGIGKIVADLWLQQGKHCYLVARNKQNLTTFVKDLQIKYPKQVIRELSCDVSNEEELASTLELITPKSDEMIVAMLNCIGYGIFENYNYTQISEIKQMFVTNTFSTIIINQYFANMFREQKKGHLLNIASMAGKIATPKSSLYSATKFAIIGYLNSLRLEVANDNVFVTTINPGPIATAFFDKADPTGKYLASLNKQLILRPDKVAKKIIKVIGRNKREINIPIIMNIGYHLYVACPKLGDYLTRTIFNKK